MFEFKMENSLYVRQNKTGSNKEDKIFADILFLWMVSGVCLVSCLLYPKVDLRPSFISKFSGNIQQVSTDSGMWSVSKEWKVQCLNRKISG